MERRRNLRYEREGRRVKHMKGREEGITYEKARTERGVKGVDEGIRYIELGWE